VVSPYIIVAFSAFTLWRDVNAGNWGNAAFAGLNTFLALSAIVAYIGIWNSIVDIWIAMTGWLYVDVKKKPTAADVAADDAPIDWRTVLYRGDNDANNSAKLPDSRKSASSSKGGVTR